MDGDQVSRLIEQLSAPDASRRQEAAEALGELGDPRALQPLMEISVSDDSPAADAAVTAIGCLGGATALVALQAVMPPEEPKKEGRRKSVPRKRRDQGETVDRFQALVVLVTDSNPDVRASAVAIIGGMDDPRGLGLAISGLSDRDAGVRRVAARVLGEVGSAVAVESLLSVVDDADSTVRRAVIDALGEIGDLRAADALLAVARRPPSEGSGSESADREAARRALGRLAALHPGQIVLPDGD